MSELVVQRVAFTYSSFEDRLMLRCVVAEEVHELWVTLLMSKQLVPALANWVVKSGGAQSTNLIRRSFKYANAPAATHNETFSISEERKVLQSLGHKSELEQKSEKNIAVDRAQASSVWLCSSANIAMGNDRIRMRVGSERESAEYIFTMTPIETGHFLFAYKKALEQVYWPIDWPEWLDFDTSVTESQTLFLH